MLGGQVHDGVHVNGVASDVRHDDGACAQGNACRDRVSVGVVGARVGVRENGDAANHHDGHHATWIGDRGNDDFAEGVQVQCAESAEECVGARVHGVREAAAAVGGEVLLVLLFSRAVVAESVAGLNRLVKQGIHSRLLLDADKGASRERGVANLRSAKYR